MPLFSEDISQRFMMERFGQYADGEEASTLEIIWGIVSNPFRLIGEIFTPFFGTVKYLLGQWLPLAFVPAVAPASWMIAGFPLLKLFIAKGESVLAITIRYAMTVVPGLFYGAILWWANRQKQHPEQQLPSRKFKRFWIFCIGLSLFFTLTSNPNRTLYFLIPDSVDPLVYIPITKQWNHVQQFRPLLAEIPPDASVAATTYLIPQLSSRREVLRFPQFELYNDAGELVKMEYLILDLWQMQQYQAAFKHERDRLKEIVPIIDQFTATNEYGMIGFENGVVLMQKAATSNPQALENWNLFQKELEPILAENQ
jgi:hypothetical protein